MLFTIAMWVLVIIAACAALAILVAVAVGLDVEDKSMGTFAALLSAALTSVAPGLMFFGIWLAHAEDLSKILAQDQVIAVQVERIDSLTARLNNFDYPSSALMNADTPVGSIVAAINEAEEKLARAKSEAALAIRSVEARRIGPFSEVIDFAGDYK